MRLKIAAVDLISNTCFPLLAADTLGFFTSEKLEVTIELNNALLGTQALRSGSVDMVAAGSIYDILTEFPNWSGAKLLVALSRGSPWLLTVRKDLAAERGEIEALRGLRLTAAAGPDLAFKQLLRLGGLDPEKDVDIVELPGAKARGVSFGVFAADALRKGEIDGFWANAMGAETAVSSGVGKVLVDVRRGDDPGAVRHFTFAGIATTDQILATKRPALLAFVRAIVKAQRALRDDPGLAEEVGRSKFPDDSAALIARTIARDVTFYDPVITEDMVNQLNAFAHAIGHLTAPVGYHDVVDVGVCEAWK
jgi:ABC-type nitrate/sulfonate/bicarbonate transport system substrate-binding protein